MAYVGRNIPIEAIRFATFNQAIDELRHAQIEIKHYAHMSKEIDGLHSFAGYFAKFMAQYGVKIIL